MAKVYFCNKEPIDLNAIAIMGVSVKTGENPIGYFGTGLKFSIATLLRTGHEIVLLRDGERIEFSDEPEVVRGEEFRRVRMGDDRLGFTTQLGRNWEPWQAYRELYCNCTDENGVIGDKLPAGKWGTIFEVTGSAIELCHRNRREIFLDGESLFSTAECAIYGGESRFAFYRGVRAHEHSRPSLFTYNIIDSLELTEDRTVKNGHMIDYWYGPRAIASCDDESIIEQAVMAPRGTFEHGLSYDNCGKPSLTFMDVCFRLRNDTHANHTAIKLWEKHADIRLTYSEATLDAFDEVQIDKALDMVRRLGADVCRRDFLVVDGLGKSIYGYVRGSQILIAKATLDMGIRFIASTIYEEWLHKTERLKDESRELQNMLFEKLFAMTERVMALEERRTARAA
jgi:hypothetical protein